MEDSKKSDGEVLCAGKQSYESWDVANKVAKKSKVGLQVYQCRFCQKWHLGSKGL